MEIPDPRRAWRDELWREANLCAGALVEARRLVSTAIFGAGFGRVLARACDLLDQMDEVLIGLHPGRDCETFSRVAALHRELEEIQSLVPREFRWLQRRSRYFPSVPRAAVDIVESGETG